MELKKRERSANFNNVETQLLVSLVEKYKQIIENKKTDAVTNKNKESAWRKIENSFNSRGITTSVRSWKTLKLKYEGIKKDTKKKSSLQRREMYRTGGGPSNPLEYNDVEEKVQSISSNIKGLEERHDSDTIAISTLAGEVVFLDSVEISSVDTAEKSKPDQAQQLNVSQDITQAQEINIKPDLDESLTLGINEEYSKSQKENKWDRWQPKNLRTRVYNILKTEKASNASVTSNLDKLSAAQLELVQLQIENARKDQQFMEEKHKLQMLHLAHDEKRKQEIHELLVRNICCGPVTDSMM